jgi:hypothetical protein
MTFHTILHRLFDHPSVTLIGGVWKSGKTDFSLFIAETLLKLPYLDSFVISEVASNIDTKGTFPIVSDTISLKQWLYSSTKRKLMIFDELNEHLAARRAMTSKNTGFISLIPEISKAHARILLVGHQLLTVDKTFLDDIWCRGVFIKKSLKSAQVISQSLKRPTNINDIPKTTVRFDPYSIAPWSERPAGNVFFKNDKDKQTLYDWAHGQSCKDLGLYPMQLNRICRRYIRDSLDLDLVTTHT